LLLGALGAAALTPVARAARAVSANGRWRGPSAENQASAEGWAAMPLILKRVVPPRFRARDFDVTRFGAKADDKSDARAAISAAIDACNASGGGRVVVPSGAYRVNGPLHLKSNVNLFLAGDATLKFSTRPSDYLPVVLVRWEGTRCYNYSPLIYAYRQKNLAITGTGTLDGQANTPNSDWARMFTKPTGRPREDLRIMGRTQAPLEQRVFGPHSSLRPAMVQFYECANILLEGVTFAGPPFWTLNPTFSTNITARRVTIVGHQPHTLPNDDGFVPDSCHDVLVDGCTFDISCDNVSIKAGRDNDAWNGMSSDGIVVRGSTFKRGCGGIVIGSEVSGGVRNVFAEDNVTLSGRYGVYVKSNAHRGGVVERLFVRNHSIQQVEDCIRLESGFMDVRTAVRLTPFRHFEFERISCGRATEYGIRSEGLARAPIERVAFRNVNIGSARTPIVIDNPRAYTFDNVTINGIPVS
jgi:polygalacturonase